MSVVAAGGGADDDIVHKAFYFADATRQSAEQLLRCEPHKVAIVRPSTQVREKREWRERKERRFFIYFILFYF
jgi:hypothetical protein